MLSPSILSSSSPTPSSSGTLGQGLTPSSATTTTPWEGVFISTSSADQTAYFGPSSTSYFLSRIGVYLAKTLHGEAAWQDRSLQPRGVSRTTTLMSPPDDCDSSTKDSFTTLPQQKQPAYMSRTSEEHFLDVFWEYYHGMMPILDERAFRTLYRSLWGKTTRKRSALVDIVLALSIQYGYTFIPRGHGSPRQSHPDQDATIAGRWYYRRCQAQLAGELEAPTLATVQCLTFSAVYLCCASFQNLAHSVVAQALRAAQVLGLHLEPPALLPLADRELRKRLWWVLYTMETKMCIKLGRPSAVNATVPDAGFGATATSATMTVTLPREDAEVAALHGTERGVWGTAGNQVTWLSYAVQCHRLLLAVDRIHRVVWPQYGRILAAKATAASPYHSPEALEACAAFLSTQLAPLQAWRAELPGELQTPRRGQGSNAGSRPFSQDTPSPLAFDALPSVPAWLQRQRICLEMLYHTMAIDLYRPFVTFCPSHALPWSSSQAATPTADAHAAACARHAVALVAIMHQAVLETDLMRGWHEFFLWHWNAVVTLVGFLLANPVHVAAAPVRTALDQSIEVCDTFERAGFAVAASAATIARDLTARADLLIARIRGEVLSGVRDTGEKIDSAGDDTEAETMSTAVAAETGTSTAEATFSDSLSWLDPHYIGEDEMDGMGEFMDWALTVDAFNSFEHFNNISGDV